MDGLHRPRRAPSSSRTPLVRADHWELWEQTEVLPQGWGAVGEAQRAWALGRSRVFAEHHRCSGPGPHSTCSGCEAGGTGACAAEGSGEGTAVHSGPAWLRPGLGCGRHNSGSPWLTALSSQEAGDKPSEVREVMGLRRRVASKGSWDPQGEELL